MDPEFVLQDARAAGFRVVGVEDPFTIRGNALEWLVVLQPREPGVATTTAAPERSEAGAGELADPALKISVDEFRKLLPTRSVTIIDVRDADSYAAGHILVRYRTA